MAYSVKRPTRREGRGQLSTIDLLPEAADEAIAWANAQLRERVIPQNEILRQFNAMLADHGIAPVSRSAFSRHSVKLAIETRKIEASREITSAVLAQLPKGDRTDSTIAAIELVKFRLIELITSEEEINPKLLLNASLALQRLSATAAREAEGQRRDARDQREEAEREREEAERHAAEKAEAEARETADTVAKIAGEAGLSADRIAAIRKGVLGLAG